MTPPSRDDAPKGARILVVDDNAGQVSLLESFLTGQGFDVVVASSGEQALDVLNGQGIGMMISDIRMPGLSGLETLRRAREKHPILPVLLVTAYADVRDAVEAMRDGAVNYLEKPIDLDELLTSVRLAIGIVEPVSLEFPPGFQLPETTIAQSPQIRDVYREAALVAPSDTRITISGESGAGKEVVADLIHAWSARASGPYVKVNCAAISGDLIESELFGYENDASAGTTGRRVGHFERAKGGTILLDEIADLSLSAQAELLRITERGTYRSVGSDVDRSTDARILATTSRNLEVEVERRVFREDLFFRLNVMEIYVPPLRERPADIVALANRFASQFSGRRPRLSASTVSCLELHDWPGNVRELCNAMERATLMARGEVVLPEHLPKRIQKASQAIEHGPQAIPQGRRMEEIERTAILQTLRERGYNRTETARTLGISRRALIYKLKRFAEQGYAITPD